MSILSIQQQIDDKISALESEIEKLRRARGLLGELGFLADREADSRPVQKQPPSQALVSHAAYMDGAAAKVKRRCSEVQYAI